MFRSRSATLILLYFFFEIILDEAKGSPKLSEALYSPPWKQKPDSLDRRINEELVAVLNKTAIMVFNFHQNSGLSQLLVRRFQ